ncbi:hypothetical protein ASG03_04315 [Rhizobium sp. Leaf341]|nr:hypothetical protein ASG03_04315 [Rhizobium sp. Leaf341]
MVSAQRHPPELVWRRLTEMIEDRRRLGATIDVVSKINDDTKTLLEPNILANFCLDGVEFPETAVNVADGVEGVAFLDPIEVQTGPFLARIGRVRFAKTEGMK